MQVKVKYMYGECLKLKQSMNMLVEMFEKLFKFLDFHKLPHCPGVTTVNSLIRIRGGWTPPNSLCQVNTDWAKTVTAQCYEVEKNLYIYDNKGYS